MCKVPWHTIIIRALDLITVVVPPALPATLSIGTSFAISRLRKAGIFCISPSRVNVAGKINVCCFDKTGTLTEDGLDILGIRPLERNGNQFSELMDDIHDLPMGNTKATFLHALATCHSLRKVDGELIGDPLDVKMFEFTGWTLEEAHAGIGNIKAKGAVVEQAQLVQVVVRPPGGAAFRLEDALRGDAKVHFSLILLALGSKANVCAACIFLGTWSYPNIRVRLVAQEDECHCQEVEGDQHGSLRQGRSRGHDRDL